MTWWARRRARLRTRDRDTAVGSLDALDEAGMYEVMARTGLGPARIFVALHGLECEGRVVSRQAIGALPSGPRRRLYRLTERSTP